MTAKITRHHGNLPNVVISPLTAVTQDILAKFVQRHSAHPKTGQLNYTKLFFHFQMAQQ